MSSIHCPHLRLFPLPGNENEGAPEERLVVAVTGADRGAHFLLGKSYAGTGEVQPALEEYNEALKLNPKYKEVHFQLYELYARLGDKEKSQEHLRISEKLTREEHDIDKVLLQDSLQKQRDAGAKP